jgi:hypothetical protein
MHTEKRVLKSGRLKALDSQVQLLWSHASHGTPSCQLFHYERPLSSGSISGRIYDSCVSLADEKIAVSDGLMSREMVQGAKEQAEWGETNSLFAAAGQSRPGIFRQTIRHHTSTQTYSSQPQHRYPIQNYYSSYNADPTRLHRPQSSQRPRLSLRNKHFLHRFPRLKGPANKQAMVSRRCGRFANS